MKCYKEYYKEYCIFFQDSLINVKVINHINTISRHLVFIRLTSTNNPLLDALHLLITISCLMTAVLNLCVAVLHGVENPSHRGHLRWSEETDIHSTFHNIHIAVRK